MALIYVCSEEMYSTVLMDIGCSNGCLSSYNLRKVTKLHGVFCFSSVSELFKLAGKLKIMTKFCNK